MPDRRPLRIVIAEDVALLREGLVGILEKVGHQIIAAVSAGTHLLHDSTNHLAHLLRT